MSDNNIMNTDQWLQYYNHNLAGQTTAATSITSSMDATIISTTNTANNPGMNAYGSTSAANPNLNPDGRVAKPARRRSRASRRTPTTLLNTDTTNFRAMVQQYTGGPSASFPNAGFGMGGPPSFNVGHGTGLHQQHHNMISNQLGIAAPAGTNYREGDQGYGGFRLQFQQQPAQYMFTGNNLRPNVMDMATDDQIGMDGLGSAYGAAPPGDSSSGENKSRNSFLF